MRRRLTNIAKRAKKLVCASVNGLAATLIFLGLITFLAVALPFAAYHNRR